MSIAGDWQMVVQSPMGKQHFTVSYHEDGGVVTGTLTNNENKLTTEIFDGSVAGDELVWKATLKQIRMTLAFNLKVTDDTMAGKVKAGPFGRFNVSAERGK